MKILFINSVCSRNGSTLLLLNFLSWIKSNHPEIECHVLSATGGTLSSEFDSVCSKHYKVYEKKNLIYRSIRYVLRKSGVIKLQHRLLYDYEIAKIGRNKYDIIYNNTIFNLDLSTILKVNCSIPKMILHVHEMQNFINSVHPRFEVFVPSVDLFVAVSKSVKGGLVRNWNVENIELVYAMSNIRKEIKTKKLDKDKIIISGSGRGAKQKGLDFFIDTCYSISRILPDVNFKFQWLGFLSDAEIATHQKMIEETSISSMFHFLEERSDTKSFYEETSIFIMSSREDSFPLVCVEAGSFGTPIFLFDKTTGTQEVISDLDYLIAPQFDVEVLARKIVDLLQDELKYTTTSKIMNERFIEFNIDNQGEKLLKIITSLV